MEIYIYIRIKSSYNIKKINYYIIHLIKSSKAYMKINKILIRLNTSKLNFSISE